MKKTFAVPALAASAALFCSACAGGSDADVRTYWLKNSTTGTYSRHETRTPLSAAEIRELGLTKELPPDARTTD